MNMQAIMMQAKKMQRDIEKTQNELESKTYEGKSQLVTAVVGGNNKLISINALFCISRFAINLILVHSTSPNLPSSASSLSPNPLRSSSPTAHDSVRSLPDPSSST